MSKGGEKGKREAGITNSIQFKFKSDPVEPQGTSFSSGHLKWLPGDSE